MADLDLSHAYDGISDAPQHRELQPLERDIICRILRDAIYDARRGNPLGTNMRPVTLTELPILEDATRALDPRVG